MLRSTLHLEPPMPLRFTDRRAITSVDDLTALQAEQLRQAGIEYDGEDLPAVARLADDDDEETSFLGYCHFARLVDGDQHLYDAWLYMVDSGTFFRAGTTEAVGGIIQFGLEVDDPAIEAEIGPAMVAAGLLPRSDSAYGRHAAALAVQGSEGPDA
ncbi:MAG: hypothetical protein R3F60_08515 [bacterium]